MAKPRGLKLLYKRLSDLLEVDLFLQNRAGFSTLIFIFTGGITGLAVFLFIYGVRTLDVTNVGWLLGGNDISAHYLGWVFFRAEPWAFPLGKITGINYPYGSNIVFTDSIPLFALFFKLISRALPATFQFFGWWSLLCFILQGDFSALLIHELTGNRSAPLFAPYFFCTAPILIHRVFYHSALAGQWILLLSLYLLFRGRHFDRVFHYWPLVFFLSLLIHPYLFLMSFLIFLAALAEQLAYHRKWIEIEIWTAACAVVAVGTLYALGLFSGGVFFDARGYGQFKANLNAFINPIQQYWSIFIPARQNSVPSMEGFNYPGVGILLLFLVSLALFFRRNPEKPIVFLRRNGWFLVVCTGLVVFSLSNTVSVDSKDLFTYPLPSLFLKLANIFRSSGRFLWPVFYLVIIFGITTIARRISSYKAALILALALVIQWTDLSQAIRDRQRIYYNIQGDVPARQSSFWQDAAARVKQVTILPPDNPDWVKDALFAAQYHLPMNHFYYALTDPRVVKDAEKTVDLIKTGIVPKDELILIKSDDLVCDLLKRPPKNSTLAWIDGEWVLVSAIQGGSIQVPELDSSKLDIQCR